MATAIVPLKLKSRRLPNKNFLLLGGKPLASYIFETLLSIDAIKKVYCYTSEPFLMELLPERVNLLPRPKSLDGDSVRANELFRYAIEGVDDDVILICQAPGPYISSESIAKGLNAVKSGDYDSAFAVKRLQTYCWYDGKPLNYDLGVMKQTQDLLPVYAETSGFYVFRKNDYLKTNTRINGRTFFVEVDDKEAIDIDNPKDFSLAISMLDYDERSVERYSQDPYIVNIVRDNKWGGRVRHIAFDMDGVLIDSVAVMEKAWAEAMKSVGLKVEFSEYRKEIGRPFFDILKTLNVDQLYWDPIRVVYEKISALAINEISLTEGILVALSQIKALGVKISLVTSKPVDRVQVILDKYFEKDIFDSVVTPESVANGRGKPAPDQLLMACIGVGVDPGNTIYVGDMEVDRVAAKSAGIHFIHAAWGYGDISVQGEVWFNCVENFTDFLVDALSNLND